jgi:bifunctional UDP-N-acetylglucosamine pyrophosphorylase / glucosamine-1-phosphate N-acetyltransferase
LILAAGLGTRMRSNLAKVLHELDGRPLINHVCGAASALAPNKIFVVVGHQGEDVERAVLSELDEASTGFVWQKKQLGTGDAVNAARDVLADKDSTLLVLSGDVPMIKAETLAGLVQLHREHRGSGAACTILTVRLIDPTGYGRVVRDEHGFFDRIVEQKDASDEVREIDEVNSGIYCFDTRKLFDALLQVGNHNAQGEYYLTDVPHILRDAGEEIAIYQHNDHFEIDGVNDRRQLASLELHIRERTVTRLMLESGVTFIDPKNAYISSRAVFGRDTVIHPNVTIEGESVVGEGCVLHSGTRIVNSTIGVNVEIRDNCLIIDSAVGDRCTVGPMAHLRGHAEMVEGSKVGNFVEMKKSTLGRGSKASHLTYDGVRKHETHIGDNVKIGSDTMLVAPVTVGDGAVTGAGSVVTKDIPANKLAVGAPARSIRDVLKSED